MEKVKYFVMYKIGDLVHCAPCPTWEKTLVEMAYLDAKGIGRLHVAVNIPEKTLMVKMPLTYSEITRDATFWLDEDALKFFDVIGLDINGFKLKSIYGDGEIEIKIENKSKTSVRCPGESK